MNLTLGGTVMNIEIVLAYEHTQEINALFSEYTNMLITNDSSFQNYLDFACSPTTKKNCLFEFQCRFYLLK